MIEIAQVPCSTESKSISTNDTGSVVIDRTWRDLFTNHFFVVFKIK